MQSLILGLTFLLALCVRGFAQTPVLIDTQNIEIAHVDTIFLTYNGDDLVLLPGDTDGTLVIKEYLTANSPDYYAKVAYSGRTLVVTEGQRPDGWRRGVIEAYIPPSWKRHLRINIDTAAFRTENAPPLNTFELAVKNGSASIGQLTANSITAQVSTGKFSAGRLTGTTTITCSTGSIAIQELYGPRHTINAPGASITIGQVAGSASITTVSGNIEAGARELSGNVLLKTISGNIKLLASSNLSFILKASTVNGAIRVGSAAGSQDTPQQTSVTWRFGSIARYTITAQTVAGDVELLWQ